MAQVRSAEPLFYKEHEFLLAFVREFHILDELCELCVAVVREDEGVSRLAQEVDEVSVVAGGDVCEARVRRVDVRCDGSLEELAQRRSVVAQGLACSARSTAGGQTHG